jgi:SAM-dependent methyltransferase
MAASGDSELTGADGEQQRVRHIETFLDPVAARRLEATGIDKGWRCWEAGAGSGSIARWLAERIGSGGTVLATDVNTRLLNHLPPNVEVWRHDLLTDAIEPASHDLVHCRAVLQYTKDPDAALQRLAQAVKPGGWLVVEEIDCGLLALSGSPGAAEATALMHDMMGRLGARNLGDYYLGRKLPGMVADLGWDDFGTDAVIAMGVKGSDEFEAVRLSWPEMRSAAAVLTEASQDDLSNIDSAWDAASARIVSIACFGAWGRKPASAP